MHEFQGKKPLLMEKWHKSFFHLGEKYLEVTQAF